MKYFLLREAKMLVEETSNPCLSLVSGDLQNFFYSKPAYKNQKLWDSHNQACCGLLNDFFSILSCSCVLTHWDTHGSLKWRQVYKSEQFSYCILCELFTFLHTMYFEYTFSFSCSCQFLFTSPPSWTYILSDSP